MTRRVVLYSKPGCHLCEIAHQLIQGLEREFPLAIEERDITRDQALFNQYKDKIPVVVIDEATTLMAPIRVADVRRALAGGTNAG